MTIEDEVLWLEERLQAMNPSINLNDGSPANIQVVRPFRRRFQPDPLESSIIPFILGRIRQEFPNITAEEGDAFIDLVVKPMSIMLEPFRREIRAIKRNQSIADPSTLNKDEADAIIANTFFTRSAGDYSRGKIRVYFANPVTLSVGSSNVGYTSGGLRYLVSQPQSITSASMLLNTEGQLYYWDIDYVAEATGKVYDIDKNKIIGVTGIASATKATNPFKFSGGEAEETTVELVARSEESIGERSLNTVPGAIAKLFEEFDQLNTLQVIGYNDVEMERDVITGGSLGDIVLYQSDNVSIPNDGDYYSSYVNDTSGTDFTSELGPVGTDLSDYTITLWLTGSWTGVRPVDYQLGEVVGSTQLKINSRYTYEDRIPAPQSTRYTIRKREILLSDIPGGILFPDTIGNELSVEPDQVHIGGCSDYYVNGGTQSELTVALDVVADVDPIVKGVIIQTYDGTTAPADRVDVTMTNDQYDEIVENKTMLRILDSPGSNNLGTYRIVRKLSFGSGTAQLIISEDLVTPEESGVYGDIIDDIDVELTDPYEIVVEGEDLRTYAGLFIVDTIAGTNFTDYGISIGTTELKLLIEDGEDAGTYEINSVAATVLTLQTSMTDTNGPLSYKIIRSLSDPIELPLRRVVSLELLDSNSDPTGDTIPYRHPIDVQSRRFANMGRVAKAGTASSLSSNDTLSSTASSDIVTSSETGNNFWSLGVRLNDVVNINNGDNQGYYLVAGVGGGPAPIGTGLSDYQLRLSSQLTWAESGIQYEVGWPSVGSFRLYFLDPCSVSVTAENTRLSITSGLVERGFRPDPAVSSEILPSETTVPTGSMAPASSDSITLVSPDGGTAVRSWNYGVKVGDYAEITYAPIIGNADLATPITLLDGKSLLIDVGSGNERVTFDATGALTGAEIVSQINAQMSQSIASLYTDGAFQRLMLRGDHVIVLRDNSAAPGAGDATGSLFDDAGADRDQYMPWLTGDFAGQDTDNDSHVQGRWEITDINDSTAAIRNELVLGQNVSGTLFSNSQTIPDTRGHYVRISRDGYQHISAVDMSENRDDLGMYYWDVECTSEGYGDPWNVEPDIQGAITGYESDGWEISVADSRLSYSMAEETFIHISPRVLLSGDDDPDSFTTVLEESIQVAYEKEDIVESIHSYIRSPSERVLNNNPLARGLTPTMVRTFIAYSGGYTETAARAALANLVTSVMPNRELEASDMVQILVDSGASYVSLPITIVGISHQTDRSIIVERSEDFISNDRLSALVPDDDGTTTDGNSYIGLSRS